MKIELEVDETVLIRSAEQAWSQLFDADTRYHTGGEGYKSIVVAALVALRSEEVRAEIERAVREVARLRLRAVVEDGVNQALNAEVKAAIKRLKAGGTLFEEVEP